MTVSYEKDWLSIDDQLLKLESYGLIISDRPAAENFLKHLNYYRFSGYGLVFEKEKHVFYEGTTFENIQAAYNFDRDLRDLITESLEVIELDLRSNIAYSFGQVYEAFGHVDAVNFFRGFNHLKWIKKLHNETSRSSELFVKHYRYTYDEFPDLPIWVATEIISFGGLSHMYSGMQTDDQKIISNRYGLQPKTLESWMHHLVYTRNLCAHHSRIWDRKWSIKPAMPAGNAWKPPLLPENDRLFATLLVQSKILRHCWAEKEFSHKWRLRVEELLDRNIPEIPNSLSRMGISEKWKNHSDWNCL